MNGVVFATIVVLNFRNFRRSLKTVSMRSFRLTREKRIECVEGEQKRGEEREQTRETQGFAFARRRPHDDDEEEEEIEEEGNEFCVFTARVNL